MGSVSSSPERRNRALRILGGLISALLLFIGASWIWLRLVEGRKWTEMERRVAELSAEALPANPDRRPLAGEPVPGDAWRDYEEALDPLSIDTQQGYWRDLVKKVDDYVRTRDETLKAEALTILKDFSSAMEALRRGARRASARGPLPSVDSTAVSLLSDMLRNQACVVAAATPDEATDLLLDLLQFGVDLDSAGISGGRDACTQAVNGLSKILTTIPPVRRAEVERALHRVEKSLSPARKYRCEMRYIGRELLQKPLKATVFSVFVGTSREAAKSDWKYGFSSRHVAADLFAWLDRWMSQVVAWEDLPYAEAKARADDQEKEIKACPNRMAATVGGWGLLETSWKWNSRDLAARIHILRTACGAEGLKDPYGDFIKSVRRGDELRIWSVGPDGKDDGGQGGWSPGSSDIVLEVRR